MVHAHSIKQTETVPASGVRVFVFFACLFMLITGREAPIADARVVYDTTSAIIDHGRLTLDAVRAPDELYTRHDGRLYGQYPLGNVVAMMPSYLAFKLLRPLPGVPLSALYDLTSHLSPALLMAAACALLFVIYRRGGATFATAVGVAAMMALATPCLIYARQPYSEALQTAALLWLLERSGAEARAPNARGLLWMALGAAALAHAKVVYLPVVAMAALHVVWHQRRQGRLSALLRASLPALIVFTLLMALMLGHDWIKTGSPWRTGYPNDANFSAPLAVGLGGLTISWGKGLLIFAPPCLLGLAGLPASWRRDRAWTLLLAGIIVFVALLNGKFIFWFGGWCWGPRYLVPIVPLFLLLAAPWLTATLPRRLTALRRGIVAALLVSGVLVQLLGASLYWDCYLRIVTSATEQAAAPHWEDRLRERRYSALFGHAWLLSHLIRNDADLARDAPWRHETARPVDLSLEWRRLRVDWWYLDWREQAPQSGRLLLLSMAAALIASGGALFGARREP